MSLPLELWITVCAEFNSTHPADKRDLARICLVSRHFASVARPVLYSQLQHDQLLDPRLYDTLVNSEGGALLGALVKDVVIQMGRAARKTESESRRTRGRTENETRHVFELLGRCPNISQALFVLPFTYQSVAMAADPKLQSLRKELLSLPFIASLRLLTLRGDHDATEAEDTKSLQAFGKLIAAAGQLKVLNTSEIANFSLLFRPLLGLVQKMPERSKLSKLDVTLDDNDERRPNDPELLRSTLPAILLQLPGITSLQLDAPCYDPAWQDYDSEDIDQVESIKTLTIDINYDIPTPYLTLLSTLFPAVTHLHLLLRYLCNHFEWEGARTAVFQKAKTMRMFVNTSSADDADAWFECNSIQLEPYFTGAILPALQSYQCVFAISRTASENAVERLMNVVLEWMKPRLPQTQGEILLVSDNSIRDIASRSSGEEWQVLGREAQRYYRLRNGSNRWYGEIAHMDSSNRYY